MYNRIDTLHSAFEALKVAHIPDEKTQLRVRMAGVFHGHMVLLLFIAGIHHEALHVGPLGQYLVHEGFTKGAGTAGDEYGFVREHGSVASG